MKTVCLLWLLQLPSSAPVYREDTIVNAASQTGDRASPNSILTIYGANLTFPTASDVEVRIGEGVGDVLFASPTQINVVVPQNLRAGTFFFQLFRNGAAGPRLQIRLQEQAPELFATPQNWLLATRADGSLITAEAPARPGETIVFYGTGLGPVVAGAAGSRPDINYLLNLSEFEVLVNGEPLPGLYYAGLAPRFRGLYQVNYTLPESRIHGENPEVRVAARGNRSREGTRLFFKP
ncbi:MAG: hypothetical protein K2X03_15560 [Bryobacteraceae bacterium]|nr:hypothetical protein [Bryobacteraceae bacterium]